MEAVALAIAGCYLLKGERPVDERGHFLKLFNAPAFAALGLQTHFAEAFVSSSRKGVVRGLHFQVPPYQGAKLVCCLAGSARDGFTDLRRGSPSYGQSLALQLCADEPAMLYLPAGIAHGFASHTDGTMMWYLTSSAYEPAADTGILWDSADIDWWSGTDTAPSPIVSTRDRGFATLANYDSPFVFPEDS